MLRSVHLVGEDDNDDLYADFEQDYNPVYDTEGLNQDEGFQQALQTSYGRRRTAGRQFAAGYNRGPIDTIDTGASQKGSSIPRTCNMGRPMTGLANGNQARPMTAVRAAGYTSLQRSDNIPFDPLNQARGPAPPLESKMGDSPEEKVKVLEKQILEFIEKSCFSAERKEFQTALEKVKEAARLERQIVRQRQQSQLADQINSDVTFSVLLNLAISYHRLQLYQEGINAYNVIVKNKMFSNASRLRVNIGNMYFEQHMYPQAVKYYRMALDQIPNTHKGIRIRMMKNIGLVFVKMGQYADAINTYELIMSDMPDIETGFNLLICVYAIEDTDKMKKVFQKMTLIKVNEGEEKYNVKSEDHQSKMILEAMRNDPLRKWEQKEQIKAEKYITMSVKLISPVIEGTFDEGFDWCLGIVRSSVYVELANELEITRAIVYLKMKDFKKALDTLRRFEKRESKMQSQAAVNLSFMYFLQKDYLLADKHAGIAVNADPYNPAALVNKGNTLFVSGDLNKAKELYLEALRIETTCTEALYNLGLCYKKLAMFEESLDCFHKLHVMLPHSAEVVCQLGCVYEMLDNKGEALDWYQQVININPTDPSVLNKCAMLYEAERDKSQAFQYRYESYRYYPSSIVNIEWLGAYYVDAQFIEKAVNYFERAVQVQPQIVQWRLMLATCYRKSGNFGRAMEVYKEMSEIFPENVDALQALVKLCVDQGYTQAAKEYSIKIKKIQRAVVQRQQRADSARRRSRGEKGLLGEERVLDISATTGNAPEQVTPITNTLSPKSRPLNASYKDPLGDSPVRPLTSGRRLSRDQDEPVTFSGDDLYHVLLPD